MAAVWQWSEEKERQLITFYADRDYMWNVKSGSYRNRDLKHQAFRELSQLLGEGEVVSEEEVKKKFKNLRTVFIREHSAAQKANRSGAGTEDIYVPKWKYYSAMLFLRDTCHAEQSTDNLQSTTSEPEPPTPTCESVSPTPTPSVPNSSQDSSRSKASKKTKQDQASEAMDYAMNILKRKAASKHSGFLLYLEGIMDELSENKVKKLKRQVIEFAHNIQDEE